MKGWMICVVVTMLCWGAYVPMIHHGANAFEARHGSFRAFLFVGVAYFLMAGAILAYLALTRSESMAMTPKGVMISTFAGFLGAAGALGVIFAVNRFGGRPIIVAPLVFAGAPIINSIVSMIWDRPGRFPDWRFFLGVVLAGVGAAMALRFYPRPGV